jgi:radical SAM protein with 4Fe4S-binding SPASM domain
VTFPKNFCIAPFVQLTTHPTGSFSPCPYLGGTTWAPQYPTIRERWQSPELQSLREDFLSNKQAQCCERCWYEESCGKRSLRQRLYDVSDGSSDYGFAQTANFAENLAQRISDQSYLKAPKVLTIKNGNVCNARCRSCHPGDSNRWIRDAEQLHELTGKKYYNINQQERNWSDLQVAEIIDIAANIDRLELFGGEPLYNKQVKTILDTLASNRSAENITLYINTNGSVNWLEKCPSILAFKMIEIGVSIDGIQQRFNYIRNGVNWTELVHNVSSWRDALSDRPHCIDAICTVSNLNIWYLDEIKQQVLTMLPLPPFWNLLREPEYLFIGNLPPNIKSLVKDRLLDPEFADILLVLDSPNNPDRWQEFVTITKSLDIIRNESFAHTFEEFASIVCAS